MDHHLQLTTLDTVATRLLRGGGAFPRDVWKFSGHQKGHLEWSQSCCYYIKFGYYRSPTTRFKSFHLILWSPERNDEATNQHFLLPGTLNSNWLMDGNGETIISQVKVWNHPTETNILKVNLVESGWIRFFQQLEIFRFVKVSPWTWHQNSYQRTWPLHYSRVFTKRNTPTTHTIQHPFRWVSFDWLLWVSAK